MNQLDAIMQQSIEHTEAILRTNSVNVANRQLQNDIMRCNTAEQIARRLCDSFIEFQASLPDEYDFALQYVSMGSMGTLLVDRISYIDYSLVVFEGMDTQGTPMRLVQNINQLNFLMMAVKKPEPEAPRRQIGFVVPD